MKLSEVIAKYSSEDEFLDALKTEVIKLGTENPDFVYNPGNLGLCSYNGPAYRIEDAWSNNPIKKTVGPECKGCLFGQALQNMGWDVEHELNYGGEIHSLLESISPEFADSISINSLQHVQTRQDNGTAWKEATRFIQEPFVRF